eukprot:4106100-Ditylum_brightwellii.AAC.1
MHHKVKGKKKWHCNITVLQGYNHNVNGLKQDLKIEQLCQAFWDDNIDFGCLQETWLSGDYRREIKNKSKHDDKLHLCFFFHHGQPIQQDRGSGGVAILLGGKGIQAWKNAGSPDAIRGDLIDGIAQSMGLETHMKDKNNKVFKYFIITAYHPDSDYGDDVQATFLESLADLYSTAPSDATILSGEDINAQLGCNI